jgi:hypothetical protein
MFHENTTQKHRTALIFKDTYISKQTYGRWIRRKHVTFSRVGTSEDAGMEHEGENNYTNAGTKGLCTSC